MTLQDFLTLTCLTPEPVLRRAMVAALAVEAPRSPEAYRWFYCRVLGELQLTGRTDCGASEAQRTRLVAC